MGSGSSSRRSSSPRRVSITGYRGSPAEWGQPARPSVQEVLASGWGRQHAGSQRCRGRGPCARQLSSLFQARVALGPGAWPSRPASLCRRRERWNSPRLFPAQLALDPGVRPSCPATGSGGQAGRLAGWLASAPVAASLSWQLGCQLSPHGTRSAHVVPPQPACGQLMAAAPQRWAARASSQSWGQAGRRPTCTTGWAEHQCSPAGPCRWAQHLGCWSLLFAQHH